MRQQVAAVGRRGTRRGKSEPSVRQPLALSQTSHTWCWPPGRVRQLLLPPAPTKGLGSAQPWRPCTPARAAGLTDRVWTRREVWRCRGPLGAQPQAGERGATRDDRDTAQAGGARRWGERGRRWALRLQWESPSPSGSSDSCGGGQVHCYYPQRPGTRPPFSASACLNALSEALETILSQVGSEYQITFA
jgi:hypothetical protein